MIWTDGIALLAEVDTYQIVRDDRFGVNYQGQQRFNSFKPHIDLLYFRRTYSQDCIF